MGHHFQQNNMMELTTTIHNRGIVNINKDNITAKQILDLDNRISKLSEDCVHYRHSMRYANRVRKNILSCRLSEDIARLEYTKSQLHSNLLSINLT